MTADPDRVFDRVEAILADVAPEQVRWLWPGYLPVGKLVVLDGDPSVGKSTLALDLAARVSAGRPMPDGSPSRHGAVIVMSAEDGLADTVRPRLDAADADVGNVVAITAITTTVAGDVVDTRPPAIPDDVGQLEASILAHGALLVIVDVLTAYLSSETNSYRDQDVRRALAPLAAMAERTGCCVIVLRHLRKASVGSAMYAGGGSIAIVGAARVGLMAAFDPDDVDVADLNDRRRVLAVVKNNVGRIAPSLSYSIVEAGTASRIEWLGPAAHRADDLVDHDARDGERGDKETFLRDLLAAGPVASKEVERVARAEGWTLKQLRPTLRRIGGQPRKRGGHFGGDPGWYWGIVGVEDAEAPHSGNGHVQNLQSEHDGYGELF